MTDDDRERLAWLDDTAKRMEELERLVATSDADGRAWAQGELDRLRDELRAQAAAEVADMRRTARRDGDDGE